MVLVPLGEQAALISMVFSRKGWSQVALLRWQLLGTVVTAMLAVCLPFGLRRVSNNGAQKPQGADSQLPEPKQQGNSPREFRSVLHGLICDIAKSKLKLNTTRFTNQASLGALCLGETHGTIY